MRIENPESIGNPESEPIVQVDDDEIADWIAAGIVCRCGGMNGYHHGDCPRCDGVHVLDGPSNAWFRGGGESDDT